MKYICKVRTHIPILLGLVTGLPVSYGGTESVLRIRPLVVVRPGSEVKLSQLADLQSVSPDMRQRMQSIAISRAPALGEKQVITSANLTDLLRDIVTGEKKRSGHSVHVILPKAVVIETAQREMSPELVLQELTEAWQPLCLDCQLEISALSLPKVDNIRDWSLKLSSEVPRGTFSVPVELVRQDGSTLPAWITGRLATKRKVPVAKRLVNLGERIQPQDVAWEYRDTSFAYDGIPTAEEISGRHAKQGLRAGDVLWRGVLEREVAIRRGELVQVRSGSSQWEVSISVVAQQDAFIGDVVTLKNPKTNAVFVGEVKGQGEVVLR